MRLNSRLAGLAMAALVATTMSAAAQGQTDSQGNAMGSQHVGNGARPGTTTGMSNSGMNRESAGSNIGANGANHPTPSSTQGDVGPGGNNNGTRSR